MMLIRNNEYTFLRHDKTQFVAPMRLLVLKLTMASSKASPSHTTIINIKKNSRIPAV
jgi:hypothetical protein